MRIETKYHKEVEIDQENILKFNSGIPSFLEEKQFYLFPFADEGPFYILQSIQTPSLAFVVVNPFDFLKEYEVKLSEQVIEALEIENEEDAAIFVILTIQEPFQHTTANLQGPIVINNMKKLGKQVILSDSIYETRHPLLNKALSVGKEE